MHCYSIEKLTFHDGWYGWVDWQLRYQQSKLLRTWIFNVESLKT